MQIDKKLIQGSAVLSIGNFVANLGNYVFNLFAGRLLGPADYGVMASIIALLYIVSVPSVTITYVVAKYSSSFKARAGISQLANFFTGLNKTLLCFSLFIFLVFALIRVPLSSFLKIESSTPVIILGALLGTSLLAALNNATIQGLLKFAFLAFNGIVAVVVKLALGLGLIWAGLSVNGALLGFLAAFLVPYFVSFWPLKFLLTSKQEAAKVDWEGVLGYTAPVFVSTLGLTLLYTGDVVLVKHFFSADQAGLYSALSLIARVILFMTTPITMVMFPLISEKYAKNDRYWGLFFASLVLVSLAVAAMTAFYFIFSRFTVRLFFGEQYLAAAPYLGRFGIFLSLYSLCNLFASFYLAVHKTKVASLPFLFGLAQIGLIWRYHSSFLHVLNVTTGAVGMLLLVFLIYLIYWLKFGRPALDKVVKT